MILAFFGLLGYAVYGEAVEQIVTESFPQGVLILIVRCLLCFAILLTYPLQIFPVIEIVEGWLFKPEQNVNAEAAGSVNTDSNSTVNNVAMSQGGMIGSASECSMLLAPEIPKQKSRVSQIIILFKLL